MTRPAFKKSHPIMDDIADAIETGDAELVLTGLFELMQIAFDRIELCRSHIEQIELEKGAPRRLPRDPND